MTNLTSAQMWPFVWRQCRRTTPRAPDRLARTCMSRRRSMPILRTLWFWSGARPRRWRGATASAVRGFLQSLRRPAHRFRRIRLPWALLCFRPCYGSASGVGCAALQKSSVAVDRQARDGCKQRSAELSALVFASVVRAKSRAESETGPSTPPTPLSRTLRDSSQGFRRRPKISRVFYLGLWLWSSIARRIRNYAGTASL